jgi:hypothetical protein
MCLEQDAVLFDREKWAVEEFLRPGAYNKVHSLHMPQWILRSNWLVVMQKPFRTSLKYLGSNIKCRDRLLYHLATCSSCSGAPYCSIIKSWKKVEGTTIFKRQ